MVRCKATRPSQAHREIDRVSDLSVVTMENDEKSKQSKGINVTFLAFQVCLNEKAAALVPTLAH